MTEAHHPGVESFSQHYQEAILSLKRRMLAEEAALEAMGLDRSVLGGLYCASAAGGSDGLPGATFGTPLGTGLGSLANLNHGNGSLSHGNGSHENGTHGSGIHGNGIHGDGNHGNEINGNGNHGNGIHGDRNHGSGIQGNGIHGDGNHGNGIHRDGSHGNGGHGNPGNGTHGEGTLGNGGHSRNCSDPTADTNSSPNNSSSSENSSPNNHRGNTSQNGTSENGDTGRTPITTASTPTSVNVPLHGNNHYSHSMYSHHNPHPHGQLHGQHHGHHHPSDVGYSHPDFARSYGGPAVNGSSPREKDLRSPLHPLLPPPPPTTQGAMPTMQEFVNKSNLHQHSKEVHRMQEKMHKCVKCFKSFPSSQQLNQHMLVHNNIRKYRCQYCDKAFKQLSHVQQHQRRHTGERPYKCTIEGCDKAFAQLSNLQQHQRNHDARRQQSDRKPYQCSICDRRFATEVSLNNHISKLHADMYRIPERRCQVCGKQFYTEEKHIRHMNRFHPDLWAEFSGGRPLEFFIPPREVQHREKKFVCTVCSKTYSHETGLLKHLVTHPESQELRTRLWSCCVCDKVFTKESYLERHLEMKLDPEHGKALSDYKKRNGIKEVGRVNINMLLPPATSSALVSSSDSLLGLGVIGKAGAGELPSTSTQVMAATSSDRTPPAGGLHSPPPPPPSGLGTGSRHPADLSTTGPPQPGVEPRSPVLGPPTPSCSLAAADSTVPSPFSPPPPTSSGNGPPGLPPPSSTSSSSTSSSSQLPTTQRTLPALTRPLSHPSPLLNRSFSESCLSSPHPLFGPMTGASHAAAMDAVSHALHGPMSPPPPGPHGFRPTHHLGSYAPPVSSQHWASPANPANLHHAPNLHNTNLHNAAANLPPLRFGPLPFRRDYGPPRPGDQEDVVSALQSLADSIHPS